MPPLRPGGPGGPGRPLGPPFSGGEMETPDWVKQILASPEGDEASEQTRERTQVDPAVGETPSELPPGDAFVPETAPDADQLPPTLAEVEAEDIAEDDEAMSEGDTGESPDGSPPVLEGPSPQVTLEAWFDARLVREFLGRVHVLVDECRVLADTEGFHVIAVDPAHVAMVDTHLPRTSLEYYRLTRQTPPKEGEPIPEEVEFGIDLDKVMEALKTAKDRVVLRYVGSSSEGRTEIGNRGSVRTMAAVDTTGMAEVKVPNLSLPAEFRIRGRDLYEALRGCEIVSDHVALEVDHRGDSAYPRGFRLVVRAEGDVDRHERVFQAEVTFVANDSEGHRSLFPLDYLVGFLKQVKGEELDVHLGTDYPLRVDWDGATRGTYLVAPRVEA